MSLCSSSRDLCAAASSRDGASAAGEHVVAGGAPIAAAEGAAADGAAEGVVSSTRAEPTRSVASSSTAEQSSVVRSPPLEVKLHAKRLRLEDGVWEFYVEYEGQAERRWVTERDSAFPERFRTLIDDLNRAQKETINFGRQKVAWVSIARRISLVPAAIRSHSRRASRSSRMSTSRAESSLTASRAGTEPSGGRSPTPSGQTPKVANASASSGEHPASIREEDVAITETL